MLRHVPPVISAELMYALMSMGHGDELVLADANFPAARLAQGTCWGHAICLNAGIPELMRAVLELMPLDYAVDAPALGMRAPNASPPVHARYSRILAETGNGAHKLCLLDKPDFYARAGNAFAIVLTGERARFANVILKKGVIDENE